MIVYHNKRMEMLGHQDVCAQPCPVLWPFVSELSKTRVNISAIQGLLTLMSTCRDEINRQALKCLTESSETFRHIARSVIKFERRSQTAATGSSSPRTAKSAVRQLSKFAGFRDEACDK